MKKMICLILSAALSGLFGFSVVFASDGTDKWDGSIDYSWYNTSDVEFEISSGAELAALAAIVSGQSAYPRDTFSGKVVTLKKNLDMDNIDFAPIGIGHKGYSFCGTLDGGGHVICNLKLASAYTGAEVGLISRLDAQSSAGLVKNIGLIDVTISSSVELSHTGGIVGYARYGHIQNSFVRNITFSGGLKCASTAHVGGIVGLLRGSLENSYITGFFIKTALNAENVGVALGSGDDWGKGVLSVYNIYAAHYEDIAKEQLYKVLGVVNKADAADNCWFDGEQPEISNSFGEHISADTDLVAVLGDAFASNDNSMYNYGFPLLSWETEFSNDEEEAVDFAVVNRTETSVELTYTENALYSMDGMNWQDSNTFENLTRGIYTFYMKPSEDSDTEYELKAAVGERFTEYDAWDGSVDTSWYNANESVYYISSAAAFAGLSELARSSSTKNFLDKDIYLTVNIDLLNRRFNPIGYGALYFGGAFHGNGHVIKNVNVSDTASDREVGLFGRVDGRIEKLGVENISLNVSGEADSKPNVGGLVGYGRYAEISECFVRNVSVDDIGCSVTYLGGFIGYARGCSINSCYITDLKLSEGVSADRIANFCANVIETSKINGCYAGVNNGDFGYSIYGFAQAAQAAEITECYYDTAGNGLSSGSEIATGILFELKRLGEYFISPYTDEYNYGYPLQKWETFDDLTYNEIKLYTQNGNAYFQILGLKNNTEENMNPVAALALYENGYMTDARFQILYDIQGFGLYGDVVISVGKDNVSSDAMFKAMLYRSPETGIPLVKSLDLEL